MLMRPLRVAFVTWLIVCGVASGAMASPGATSLPAPTEIRGTVRDGSGAVVPGATVTATNVKTGASRSVATDDLGTYVVPVGAGDYTVQTSVPGFRVNRATATVAEGQSATLDVVLEIAPFAESEVVTVTRAEQELSTVPNAVAIVEQEAIQFAQRKVSPADVLVGIPGVFTENRRNFSLSGGVRLTIRAPLPDLGMKGLQFVQDGIPLTVADGTTQPGNVDLGSAGRVEVMRGPSSVLYGNSAGGVVSVRTEFPTSGQLNVQPDLQWGSFGYQRMQVKAGGTVGKLSYVVNTSRMQTDGYRMHSAADVRQTNAVLRVAVSAATEIRGSFNFYDLPFGENSSTLTEADARNSPTSTRQQAIDQGWGESSTQGQGGVTIEHHFTNGRVLRATGWGVWRDVWNPIPGRIIDLGRTGGGFRSEFEGGTMVGAVPVTWTTGLDVSAQHDDRQEFTNAGVAPTGGRTQTGPLLLSQLEQVRSVAPFVQVGVLIRERWRFTTGIRYDRYHFEAKDRVLTDGDQSGQRIMAAVSPMVGVVHLTSDWLNLYANVATAYATPTTVQLSNRPTGEGGFNESLKPEDLLTVEGGARGQFQQARLRYEVTVFRSSLTNAFVGFQRADQQTYFENAGKSRRQGTEVLLEWSPIARVSTRFAYTHQDFKFVQFANQQGDYAGHAEPGAPPNQWFVSAGYDAPFGLRSSLKVRWVDRYAVNNANTSFNWAYHVVDLRFGLDRTWRGTGLRPFFGVDNLFNQRYNGSTSSNAVASRYYEPAPGRELFVGLTLGVGVR